MSPEPVYGQDAIRVVWVYCPDCEEGHFAPFLRARENPGPVLKDHPVFRAAEKSCRDWWAGHKDKCTKKQTALV